MPTGLRFETRPPAARPSPNRADIACFVGLATLRAGPPLRAALAELRESGWGHLVGPEDALPPRPLPIAVESVAALDALVERHVRGPDGLSWEAPLAAAVRDFFREGGQRAWILSVGRTLAPPRSADVGARRIGRMIPGYWGSPQSEASDRDTWRGLGHLAGLPEVSFVCLPDLPFLFGGPPDAEPPVEEPPSELPPEFVEASSPPPGPPEVRVVRAPPIPRFDAERLARWARALGAARAVLHRHRRDDVQLLAAVPLGAREGTLDTDPHDALLDAGAFRGWRVGGAGSASIQLAWPWISGAATAGRLGGLAPPDGVLAGLLARNALRQGTFRAASGSVVTTGRSFSPRPTARAVRVPHPVAPGSALELSLDQRVCLLGTTPGGPRLLSDVTTSSDPLWRMGGPARLSGTLRRALARAGERLVFEPAGPRTRGALAREISATLDEIARAGGVAPGADGEPPYTVRCDTSTHTQADLDAGRLVASVTVRPSPTLEAITVLLSVAEGAVSLSEGE